MQHWVCIFDGRAGAHARAMFDTKDQARQFAERHAEAITPSGMPLKWEDAREVEVLTTPLGDYLIVPIDVE
jgi:hypothetical protein